jgi:putative spermidine/putrescine transport system permease protein
MKVNLMYYKKFKLSNVLFIAAIFIYVINVLGVLLTVIINSFGRNWFKGIVPKVYTLEWYKYAATEHDIGHLLQVTFLVVAAVVIISIAVAFPAAYVMARNEFRLKGVIMTLFLLPMLIPPMTYGVPLATLLLQSRLPNLLCVILANLVPIIPFMILIITPFIEQVGTNIESAARMLGAGKKTIFLRILVPLTAPGILTASILSIVKAVSAFDLTYLIANGKSMTLVVALYADAFAAGSRPGQAIDALACIYFAITMTFFLIAMKFVNPTQMVFKIK